MKFFGNKANREYEKRKKRCKTWPPLTEPNHWFRLAEPKEHPDRVSVLKQRIAEVEILYPEGSHVTDAARETRSPEFAPEWPSPAPLQLDIVREAKSWMVNTVCQKRSEAIPRVDDRISPLGKLLVYEVEGTVWDTASEVVSGGFFDSTDEPGWNTWIDYYEDYDHEIGARLLCYVPPPLIDLAENGIAANPVACLYLIECSDLVALP